jgi:hypothetical protein
MSVKKLRFIKIWFIPNPIGHNMNMVTEVIEENHAKELAVLEAKVATWEHIDKVRRFLRIMSVEIVQRGEIHDRSKLGPPEAEIFGEYTPKLKHSEYGSEEYKQFLKEMAPALKNHYANNRHHPEYFPDGIRGMTLIDLLEMFCDWWASSMRHNTGDIRKSIELNQSRFNMSEDLVSIFRNTVEAYEATVKSQV